MLTKKRNRIVAFVMAMLMGFSNFSMVSLAAEADNENPNGKIVSVEKLDNGKTRTTYEMELTPESVDENGVGTYLIQSCFTMKGNYYRGADRKYSGNYLNFTLEVIGADGNSYPNKQVSAELWDYNNNCLVIATATADGTAITVPNVKIVPNRTYYFKYYLVTGSSSNLRVCMYFDTWG